MIHLNKSQDWAAITRAKELLETHPPGVFPKKGCPISSFGQISRDRLIFTREQKLFRSWDDSQKMLIDVKGLYKPDDLEKSGMTW